MREPRDGGRHDQEGMATEGTVEPALRRRLGLEVELVEGALADLAHECSWIERRHAAPSGAVRLSSSARSCRTELARPGRSTLIATASPSSSPPVNLRGRRDRHRLGVQRIQLARPACRPRRPGASARCPGTRSAAARLPWPPRARPRSGRPTDGGSTRARSTAQGGRARPGRLARSERAPSRRRSGRRSGERSRRPSARIVTRYRPGRASPRRCPCCAGSAC